MAKPKLALIPSAQGSKFYSVLPSSGVGDFNFTRSGSATRINSQGLIESVANGVSRLNYPMIDGVVKGCPHHILEPQRINDLQRSQEFDNAYWTKYQTSVSANSSISPDGTLNSDKLIEDNSNSTHQLGRAIGYNSGTTYTVSLFAKSSNRNLEIAAGNTGTFPVKAIFDLSNGTVLSSTLGNSSIENYGNGWYKCIITATALVTATTNINFGLTNGSTLSYSGDGVSFIELFGAMREQGSFPTSYIPTNGSTVTRSAETANGSGDAATFNDSEGVLMVESSLLDVSQDGNRISISDGSSAENRITFRYLNDNEIQIELGLTNGFSEILNLDNSENFNKIAVVYNSTNASVFINGFNLVTDTMSALSGLSQLQFNRFNANTENFYGNTKQVQYYDTALTNSELETLTSWVSFQDMAEAQLYSIQ